MKKNNSDKISKNKFSRRAFLRTIGATSAGLFIAPYISSTNIFAYGRAGESSYLAKVGITRADNYERSFIKQKVQYLFELIDGITDIVKTGDKVAIKINLTGGGSSVPYNMWTHPEVVRAVGELVIDCGVNAQDIYIVEALWSNSSYNNYGYLDVQNSLGAKLVDLNKADPYASFVQKEVGSSGFNFSSFTLNKILTDVDVYISIPKMKQHYEAGVTCSLKNQVGIVPKDSYTIMNDTGRRGAIHHKTNNDPSNSYLPRSICDLNIARPVNLAIIDGIMNARGGEGTWNDTFRTAEDHILLVGKDPVATDSVAAYFMGNNPEVEKFQLPAGGQCDNHLYLLNQIGMGTNKMNEIEVVGDGADLITSFKTEDTVVIPTSIQLLQNFPNPFNPVTNIKFGIPQDNFVTLKIYNSAGKEIAVLVDKKMSAGFHTITWNAYDMPSGAYLYKISADNFSEIKKMILLK